VPSNKSHTVKRGDRMQWQDLIDREQSDQHLLGSFRNEGGGGSKTLAGYHHRPRRSESIGAQARHGGGVTRYSPPRLTALPPSGAGAASAVTPPTAPNNGAISSSTLPRKNSSGNVIHNGVGGSKRGETHKIALELESLRLPSAGIEELERMYAHMKNLSAPLPSASDVINRGMAGDVIGRGAAAVNETSSLQPLPLWRSQHPDHPLRIDEGPPSHHRHMGMAAIHGGGRDDDAESEICSVIADIPPPLAPVQSHAVLEESLGHHLPPLPRNVQKLSVGGGDGWGKTPPLPPRRTSSKLSLTSPAGGKGGRGASTSSEGGGIYANSMVNRSSLMSTGSSGESSGSSSSSGPASASELTASTTLSPTTPGGMSAGGGAVGSDGVFFPSWPSAAGAGASGATTSGNAYSSWSSAGSPSPSSSHNSNEDHLRSVSQLGGGGGNSSIGGNMGGNSIDIDDRASEVSRASSAGKTAGSGTVVATSSNSSHVYVKMNGRFGGNNLAGGGNNLSSGGGNNGNKESDYISVLYSALQRQGGKGSVETAISPYLRLMKSENEKCERRFSDLMNVKTALPSASIDSISAIYAQPEVRTRNSQQQHLPARTRSMSGEARPTSTSSSSSKSVSMKRSKAMSEFKELLREVDRKRQYRVGLNLFNSKPELGIEYLVQKEFLELSPASVAKFLHERNSGLAKEKVGEYLGNLQSPFAMKVLSCFVQEFTHFSGQRIDKAIRTLLSHVRVPGEAQKIERIMEVFGKRFAKCNPGFAAKLKSPDSIVTLSFAVMLLNTDLHTPNIKEDKKMKVNDFVRNLEGVDAGASFDPKLLKAIYKSVKKHEFLGGQDHVGQTQLIQQSIVQSGGGGGSSSGGKRPPLNLAEPHRRLVCLCRLFEVLDINATKKPSSNDHQRDIFLFNDLLVVTKQIPGKSSSTSSSSSKVKKSSGCPSYSYRDSFNLKGLEVTLFHTPVFDFGIQISRKSSGCVLLTLNAGSEHDRYKFVMDLQESIFEMNQMEEAIAEISAS